LAAAISEHLRAYRGPYVLESFDPRLLAALRREGLDAPLGIITYGYDVPEWDQNLGSWQRFVLRNLLHWPWTRFAFISCRDVSLGLPAVRLFRALGMPVTSWTIQSPAAATQALSGADQIVFEGFLPAIV
jgi:glycerophosphoryl diester phosphodiesterase